MRIAHHNTSHLQGSLQILATFVSQECSFDSVDIKKYKSYNPFSSSIYQKLTLHTYSLSLWNLFSAEEDANLK